MTNKIKREPIQLSKNDIAVIHIFTRGDFLEDLWMRDSEQYLEENFENHENAAKQFISQLEGRTTIRFLQCLRKEIDDIINEWEQNVKKNS